MTEPRLRRHGLESALGNTRTGGAGALEIVVEANRGFINLRGPADSAGFIEMVETTIGQQLPLTPNTVTSGEHRIFWLGPDEWLISTAADRSTATCERLQTALDDLHAATNDLSGGFTGLTLTGDCIEQVLAKGCTLDLHTPHFPPGHCAQSGLAKANVLLRRDNAERFEIVVRRSFAEYLLAWLEHAAKDFGVKLSI